ncbi:MAG TPA: hypothetical protein VGJ41_03850 [Nocardioides sp.]|jgi:uncharacterized membrane protein
MSLPRLLGGLIAATGAAHFAAPKAFEPVSSLAFPNDTRSWVYRNGAAEVAIGAALMTRKTRKLGLAGLAAYGAFLGSRVVTSR